MDLRIRLVYHLISENINFKSKLIRKVGGHYIFIKGNFQKDDVAILNIYAPHARAPKCI